MLPREGSNLQSEIAGNPDKSNASIASAEKNFLTNLMEGNLGLPMTYWVYGVLGGFVWAVGITALAPEKDSDFEKLIYLLMIAYYVAVYTGIWRASNKFTGAKVWAVLAKFIVVIVALPTAIRLIKWMYFD